MLSRLRSLWTPGSGAAQQQAQHQPGSVNRKRGMTVEPDAEPVQPSTAPSGDERGGTPIASVKRRGDDGGSPAKRQRLASATEVKGSCTDFQRQPDQLGATPPARRARTRLLRGSGTPEANGSRQHALEEQQRQQQPQQAQQHTPVAAGDGGGGGRPRTPLGTILTPVFYLLQQGSQIVQHFGTPPVGGVPQDNQQQHQQQQRQGGDRVQQQQQHLLLQQPPNQQACARVRPDQGAANALQGEGAANCATSTTSTATTGSVLVAAEASDSVAGGAANGGVPAPRGAAADSGCDSDAEGAGELEASPGVGCGTGTVPSTSAACDGDEEEDEEWFDPLLFISRLPPCAPPGCARPGTLLPRRTRACKQKTLVLDLDETLVHSTLDGAPGSEGAHFHFPVHFNGAEHMVHVRMRPHMRDFLERTAQLFELVVFTASQKVYAEKLLNILDPHRRLVRHRIYRDSCVLVEGNYLKDLSGLGRDLAHTAIVDNSPQAFGFQVDNGIPIESWYDDEGDTELLQLLPLLMQLADADDVRPLLRERFRLRERVEGAAATWRTRMEQEAMTAVAWQRQCLAPQLPVPPVTPQYLQQAPLPPGGGMMQQALRQQRSPTPAATAAAGVN